jgi:hypothetical protein
MQKQYSYETIHTYKSIRIYTAIEIKRSTAAQLLLYCNTFVLSDFLFFSFFFFCFLLFSPKHAAMRVEPASYLKNLWIDPRCDCINSFTRIFSFFFLFSLPEAYFLDDTILLKFRERISSKNTNLVIHIHLNMKLNQFL